MLPAGCIGDPQWLTQVLVNLLSNAIKFTERGGVALEAQTRAGRLEFVVSDSGVGMTSEQIGRIFSPFEQADGSTTRRSAEPAWGPISERLVRSMGGLILVSSEPGKGAASAAHPARCAAGGERSPAGYQGLPGMAWTAEAAMVVRELGARAVGGVAAAPSGSAIPEGAAMVVLEASSVMTVAGNKDAAVPQAVLDGAELRIGILGDVTVLDALEIPPPAGSHHPLRASPRPSPGGGAARGVACQRLAPTRQPRRFCT